MEYVGVDLGAIKSRVCVVHEDGEVGLEREVRTSTLIEILKQRPPSRVVMEACAESSRVAQGAKQAGHEVVVVPGKVLRQLGIGDRGIKTDIRDARTLAIASRRLPELQGVHLRSEAARNLAHKCDTRDHLVRMRTRAVNAVRGHLRTRLIVLPTRGSSPRFCDAIRTALLTEPDGLSLEIDLLLETIHHLSTQIERLTADLEHTVDTHPICKLLMTMPGVGPITSARFVAAIDIPERFASASKVASYLALIPGEASTGGKTRRTGLIAAGPTAVRACFVQAAWSMQRSKTPDPLLDWTKALAERRGKRIATVALARKMATILFAMWRTGTTYDHSRARPMTLSA